MGIEPGTVLVHGLTSGHVLAEEAETFRKVKRNLTEEWSPRGEAEKALIGRMAFLLTRLERAWMVDRVAFANCFEGDGPDGDESSTNFNQAAFVGLVNTVTRYESRLGRELAKARHQLQRRVAARGGQPRLAPVSVDFNW